MDHKGVSNVAGQKEAGENKAQLLSAEVTNQPSEDGHSHKSHYHVQYLGEQFRLRAGQVPGKKIEPCLLVELDEKRLFDGLENPKTGDDQEEVAEHQKG